MIRHLPLPIALLLISSSLASGQTTVRESAPTYSMSVSTLSSSDSGVLPNAVLVFSAPGAEVRMDGPGGLSLRDRHIPISVYPMTQLEDTEAAISQGLSNQPAEATAQLNERLARGQIPKEQLKQGWYAVMLARQLGITKLPAIVFDGNRIVYGETDLDAALVDYRRFRAGEN